MNEIQSFALSKPVWFVLILIAAWFILLLLLAGVLSGALRKPYGDPTCATLSRLITAGCVVVLAWQLGWLRSSGIGQIGTWQVWLLALAGLLYYAAASLYAFFGKIAFDFSSLALPRAREILTTSVVVAVGEELLFRGVVLFVLLRAWGGTPAGQVGAVAFAALLFALLHLSQVLSNALPLRSAVLLMLQTVLIACWWGAVAALCGSIWPAVVLHFAANAVVALQGINTPMLKPEGLAYERLLWLSLPLGALGLGLVGFVPRRQ